MPPGSPSHAFAQSLVFEDGRRHDTRASRTTADEDDGDVDVPEYHVPDEKGEQQSMYVRLFEQMINDVVRYEQHLISKAEMTFLTKYIALKYEERYLLIRLCLRKPGKWHRLSSLKFESELGSVDKIVNILRQLCGTISEEETRREAEREAERQREQKRERRAIEREEKEVIDLTLDDDEGGHTNADENMELQYPPDDEFEEREKTHVSSSVVGEDQPVAGPSTPPPPPRKMEVDSDVKIKKEESDITVYSQDSYQDEDTGDPSFFAEDDSQAQLAELLECLTTEELKKLAKQMHIKATHKRGALVVALLSSPSTQTILPFPVIDTKGKIKERDKGKGKHKATSAPKLVQTTLPYGKRKTQLDMLRELVLKQVGACIRVNPAVFTFFRRVNLIYFRCTQETSTLLTPSILSSCNKRIYAAYEYTRTPGVWLTRAELLAYERALALEAEIDGIFDGSSPASARARSRSVLSATPGPNGAASAAVAERKLRSAAAGDEEKENADGEHETAKEKDAHLITVKLREVFDEWKALLAVKPEEACRTPGLERFDAGHILTRVLHKGAEALGWLKDYKAELDMLDELLAQRRWRRGRRGRWHERRALILMTHMPHNMEYHKHAYTAVIEGLKDPDTHLVYRPKLERRLTTLEKKLQMLPDERHVIEGQLEKCKNVTVRGIRVRGGLILDPLLRTKHAGVPESPKKGMQSQLVYEVKKPGVKTEKGSKAAVSVKLEPQEAKGKSQWKGRGDEIVSVEILALQHYEAKGFKGYHCEGSIVSTLFGLLFWDVIFAPIPGAFETPYQTAPLDIAEDTFFYSRQELIEDRLRELEQGSARQILQTVDDQHRQKKTWCVGVRWDLFPQEDLLEIVDLFNPTALATICRLFCEDYAQRRPGVPDLFLWHVEDKVCKFVEVKGPGDRLQENQKVWIDVLLRAGVPVELCLVEDAAHPGPARRNKAARKAQRELESDSNTEADTEPESEEEDELNESQYLDAPPEPPHPPPPPQSSPPSPGSSQPLLRRKRSADESDGLYGPPSPKRARAAASVSPKKRVLRKRAPVEAAVPSSQSS